MSVDTLTHRGDAVTHRGNAVTHKVERRKKGRPRKKPIDDEAIIGATNKKNTKKKNTRVPDKEQGNIVVFLALSDSDKEQNNDLPDGLSDRPPNALSNALSCAQPNALPCAQSNALSCAQSNALPCAQPNNTANPHTRSRANQPSISTKVSAMVRARISDKTTTRYISDDSDSDMSESDNRFTVNDTDTKNIGVESISDDATDSETLCINRLQSNILDANASISNNNALGSDRPDKPNKPDKPNHTGKKLAKTTLTQNRRVDTKHQKLSYHCVQLAEHETGAQFVPSKTDIECWWCDHGFETLPAYIVNCYKNGIYYVFGIFCSFNCACRYNVKMLKDYKCSTRGALTHSLKTKITGNADPIRLAPADRELLRSKGGVCEIDEFRHGFDVIPVDMRINFPPIIPLVHVISTQPKK